uniref:Uncharacterized protein n=1 Tax=Arundo donax TaxID=35708 RepID=A0A0A9FWS5_ARUDO
MLGKMAAKRSATSRPSGAPPMPMTRRDERSRRRASSDLVIATSTGGAAGSSVTRYRSTARSAAPKSNRSMRTAVSPMDTDLSSIMNPNTWKRGRGNRVTVGGGGCSPASAASFSLFSRFSLCVQISATRLRCVIATAFTRPVVPDEYSTAAVSDCFTATGGGAATPPSEASLLYSSDPMTTHLRCRGSLAATSGTANATTGRESATWCAYSSAVDAGLADETMAPMDMSAKSITGTSRQEGATTSATSPGRRPSVDQRPPARERTAARKEG